MNFPCVARLNIATLNYDTATMIEYQYNMFIKLAWFNSRCLLSRVRHIPLRRDEAAVAQPPALKVWCSGLLSYGTIV